MTQDEAVALARLVAKVDGLPPLGSLQVEQRPRPHRSQTVWSVFSPLTGPGRNASFAIDVRTGVLLHKEYVGFGPRFVPDETREFIGETHPVGEKVVERELWLPADRALVFPFFIGREGLAALRTPLLEPVEPLPAELEIDSRVVWHAHLGGRTRESALRVDELREGERLIETQENGPLRRLRHVVIALEASGGTLVRERLAYQVRWGVAGELVDSLIGLTRALEDAVEARFAVAVQRFGPFNALPPSAD